jgi:competence protein ComGC
MIGKQLKIISVLILSVCLIIFSVALIPVISDTMLKNSDITKQTMEASIEKALIHCYAIEGSYPPSIDYLTEFYGIHLQEDRYIYHYEFIGSNIRPIVKVFEK